MVGNDTYSPDDYRLRPGARATGSNCKRCNRTFGAEVAYTRLWTAET